MDELEFRRRLLTDPHSTDPALQQALALSALKTEQYQQAQQFEQRLSQALALPVAPDIADKILLRQQLAKQQQRKRQNRWQLASAASIAFVFGIGLATLSVSPQSVDLGQHALAHVQHEASLLLRPPTQSVSLAGLNQKLATLGAQLNQTPADIVYANFCTFNGVRSLHIVFASPEGAITLFVIPAQSGHNLPQQFANERYQGIGHQQQHWQLAFVGTPQQQLRPFMQQLSQQLSAI